MVNFENKNLDQDFNLFFASSPINTKKNYLVNTNALRVYRDAPKSNNNMELKKVSKIDLWRNKNEKVNDSFEDYFKAFEQKREVGVVSKSKPYLK